MLVGIDDVEVPEMQNDEIRENGDAGFECRSTCCGFRVLQMEFDCPEAAFQFYEQYSRGKGFSMRHGGKLKNKNGEIIRYTLLCNRQGFREKKWLEMPGRKREHKAVTRCGCPTELRIKPKEGASSWYIRLRWLYSYILRILNLFLLINYLRSI
ncbi:hypothetical protein PIB30_119123 [Stylosanthes scabra]|uniref:FAR1 domain-containing protein n=1 Tax=Stylosanthes scabra TaxID=79078 RepID=A0ABU6Y0Q8_9FABA|nr:hypothetical protein [Stylosanthes scabra]